MTLHDISIHAILIYVLITCHEYNTAIAFDSFGCFTFDECALYY